jgi:hypothetical protein
MWLLPLLLLLLVVVLSLPWLVIRTTCLGSMSTRSNKDDDDIGVVGP